MAKAVNAKVYSRNYVRRRINQLSRIFAKASVGDFSEDVTFPKKEDDFTMLFGGVQIMLDVIREKIEELNGRIHQQRQAKLLAEEEQARSEAFLRSVGDGLMVTDKKGAVLIINRAAERMLGWKSQEVRGQSAFDVAIAEDEKGRIIPASKRPLTQTLQHGKTLSNKHFYLKKNQGRLPVAVTVAPIIFRGRIIGAVNVFRDITKDKEIDQMKSEFVSLVSHQLKTPVGEIRGYVDNMLAGLTGPLTAKQRQYLEAMRDINIQNFHLISDLLSVSRLERGVVKVDLYPLVLQEVVARAVRDHRYQLSNKGLKLKLQIPKRDIVVMADSSKLVESISNVIDNAVKFTDQGKVTISVRKDESNACIIVTDTGAGMSTALQRRLFRRDSIFSGFPTVRGGVGLGMYITKQFMKLQHGNITVESKLGSGSSFMLKIPLSTL